MIETKQPSVRDSLIQALGGMAGNRNGGRPAMPIQPGGYTTKPLFIPQENGRRLKISADRINNNVRPNLLPGQIKQTIGENKFNKPLPTIKKPVKKPVIRK